MRARPTSCAWSSPAGSRSSAAEASPRVHNLFNQERHPTSREVLQGETPGGAGRVAVSHGLSQNGSGVAPPPRRQVDLSLTAPAIRIRTQGRVRQVHGRGAPCPPSASATCRRRSRPGIGHATTALDGERCPPGCKLSCALIDVHWSLAACPATTPRQPRPARPSRSGSARRGLRKGDPNAHRPLPAGAATCRAPASRTDPQGQRHPLSRAPAGGDRHRSRIRRRRGYRDRGAAA
jgi:hypothetical protein